MISKSSQKVLEVLQGLGNGQISDRQLKTMTGIKSLQTITRTKRALAQKGLISYSATRQGTLYRINQYSKSVHKISTTEKFSYKLSERKSENAPPPPHGIDDLTFADDLTLAQKVETLIEAWRNDEQMPTFYTRHERILKEYVLVKREATPEQWLQAIYNAQDKNTPDSHHRGICWNFIVGQLKQILKKVKGAS